MPPDHNRGIPALDDTRPSMREGCAQIPMALIVSIFLMFTGYLGKVVSPQYSGWNTVFGILLYVGITILMVWFVRLWVIPIVRKQQVVEEWNLLVREGRGHAAEVVQHTRDLITTSKAPDVTMERMRVAPGIIRGVLGETRPFLVIANNTSRNLRCYQMYLNAREYGDSLQVSWYVIHVPGKWEVVLGLLLFVPFVNFMILPVYFLVRLSRAREGGLLDLDFFDLQDLTAYVTNAHHCVLDAVDRLLLDLSQDPSKIERKSRGFLGVS